MNPMLKDKLLPACDAVARELREWKATQALLRQEQLRRAVAEWMAKNPPPVVEERAA